MKQQGCFLMKRRMISLYLPDCCYQQLSIPESTHVSGREGRHCRWETMNGRTVSEWGPSGLRHEVVLQQETGVCSPEGGVLVYLQVFSLTLVAEGILTARYFSTKGYTTVSSTRQGHDNISTLASRLKALKGRVKGSPKGNVCFPKSSARQMKRVSLL